MVGPSECMGAIVEQCVAKREACNEHWQNNYTYTHGKGLRLPVKPVTGTTRTFEKYWEPNQMAATGTSELSKLE